MGDKHDKSWKLRKKKIKRNVTADQEEPSRAFNICDYNIHLNVSDYVLISHCLAGSFLPQTFQFLRISPHCLHPLCLPKLSLPWVSWSASPGPNHSRPQRPESTLSPFPLFSPHLHFHSVCRQRNDGKSTAKWWTGGRGNTGEEIDAGTRPLSLAEHSLYWKPRKKWNRQQKSFYVSSYVTLSASVLQEQCHQRIKIHHTADLGM